MFNTSSVSVDAAMSSTSSSSEGDPSLDERSRRRLEREKDNAARVRDATRNAAVLETLGRVLLGKSKPSKNTETAAASERQLDAAFLQYTTLLSRTAALHRDYNTGQSVLAELNKLHGRDEQMRYRLEKAMHCTWIY